jgi:cobalt/nickel transport system permease protein
VALLVLGQVPWRWYLRRLATLAPFFMLFVLLLPFLIRDPEPWFSLGPLSISLKGVYVACLFALKMLTIVTLMLVLLTSAPLPVTLQAAHALYMPGILIHLTLLTYRYIFLLANEFARLRVALRVRGFRSRATMHNYKTIGHVAGTLLVRSHERAERVSQAMRCRGFDGQFRTLVEFTTRPADVALFLIVVGVAAALGAWDVLSRA